MNQTDNSPALANPMQETDTANLASVAQGIASMVWWRFSGTAITPPDLRTRVVAAGGQPEDVPDINQQQALEKAVREFRVREGKKVVMEAVVAHQDDNTCTINILELQQQSAKKKAKIPVVTLVWRKGKAAIAAQAAQVLQGWVEDGSSMGRKDYREAAAKLRAEISHRQTYYDGNAVRDKLVMPALKGSSAFTLRRGMYVVPHSSAGPLAAAQAALAGMESFALHVATVQGGAGWEAPMQEAAQEQLRGELDELEKQIDGWMDMASRVRSDTREHVLRRFTSLQERCALYQQALQVSLEDLADDVQAMQERCLEVIGDVDQRLQGSQAAPAPQVDPVEARRQALDKMSGAQLDTLWMAYGEGEQPDSRDELLDKLAEIISRMEGEQAA